MRIGIDASRAFGDQKTGTESYSFEIITHLLKLPEAKKHEWILYTKENIKLPYFWTQVGLAYRTWVDKLDVLWVPAHTLPILARPGLKKIVTIHGIEYEWLPAYENWLQRWYLPLSTQYAVSRAQKIIAVSRFTQDQLVERLGADPKKITVIHEGISYKDINRQSNILDRYGLFVGTIQPRKNLVRLIKAFAVLSAQKKVLKEIKLVICGKLGWNFDEVVGLAKKYGVIITGFVSDEDRNTLLKNAMFYVQPSITEGFGLPVLEAMSAGIPVISSNGGALPEVVGNAGLLFDPSDPLDILDKLDQIISNPKLRKLLITKGFLRAKQFSWEKAARETYRILTNP
ncbi:MAG: glycosyltransferase family 1 protein [Candidatus Amesbacteria bacterium]|nr:glycosyltransferase family 1 protein [Candidatus Amesbacteria bacterium]